MAADDGRRQELSDGRHVPSSTAADVERARWLSIWRSLSWLADRGDPVRVICAGCPVGWRFEPALGGAEEAAVNIGRGRFCSCGRPKPARGAGGHAGGL